MSEVRKHIGFVLYLLPALYSGLLAHETVQDYLRALGLTAIAILAGMSVGFIVSSRNKQVTAIQSQVEALFSRYIGLIWVAIGVVSFLLGWSSFFVVFLYGSLTGYLDYHYINPKAYHVGK